MASIKTSHNEVYPRVGGGNALSATASKGAAGLSPRGRGKPGKTTCGVITAWSIPAWAGETRVFLGDNLADRVYPRVGGGNPAPRRIAFRKSGLSPRGRGKPPVDR